LVCISTSDLSERLIRISQRMASDLDAEWYAVYVKSPKEWPSDETAMDRLAGSMRLAESLGAKVRTLSGQSPAEEILAFARSQNITLLVVGLPRKSHWKRWPMTSVVNELISQSGPIHVLVIGNTESKEPEKAALMAVEAKDWRPYYGSLASVATVTVFCWMFHEWLGLINVAMILLLPVVYSGITWGRRSGLAASIAAVVALDFFFVPPQLTLAVEDLRYLPMFFVFVIVGVATSFLADLVRWQAESARQRERFVSSLYAFSRDLMAAKSQEELLRYAAVEINNAFQCEVLILLPATSGQLKEKARMGEHVVFDERKLGVATWVYQHGQSAGHGTQTLSSATFLYLPMKTKDITVGVLGVGLGKADKFLLPEQRRLLEAFTNILALAIARSEGHE
jgi:two-component system sensor histidine kinase KdpD